MVMPKFSRTILLPTSTIGLAVFIVYLSLAIRISDTSNPNGPSLFLPETARDLGLTSTRQEWPIRFQICNVGRRRLVINEVDACYGCGNAIRNQIIVPPGETVEVTVNLDTRYARGPIKNIVSFTTNDPEQPRFNLTVRAHVDAPDSPGPSRTDVPTEVSVLIRQ